MDNPEKDLRTNGLGTLKILEWCQKSKVRKLAFTSSSCVYENREEMGEDAPLAEFDTPYAVTKYMGERYCRYFSAQFGLDTVILRLFNSYGPGEHPGRYRNVIPNFFALALSGQPLPITGTGNEVRDFNFVTDTISGIEKAMFVKTEPGDVFNVASGQGTRIEDLALAVNAFAKNGAGLAFAPRRSWDHVTRRIGLIEKARKVLSYAPAVALPEGLARTYGWFLETGAAEAAAA